MSSSKSFRIHICHFTSVHTVFDTRIFFKECLSLAKYYKVTLIASAEHQFFDENIVIEPIKNLKSRIARFFLSNPIILFKTIKVRAKIYHFHDPELIPIALMLKILGKKVIFDIHELVVEDLKTKTWLPLKKITTIIYKFFENLACKYFYLILAENSYTDYYNSRASNYTVVQNFADIKMFESHRVTDRKCENLFYIGNITGKRGIPVIIRALKHLNEKDKFFKLHCVGNYDKRTKLYLNTFKEFKAVENQIVFHGLKKISEGIKISTDCFAGLALPEPIPNHISSYSTKIFEYLAVGLPVICSDFELYKNIVEQNNCGICINSLDHIKLAEAIEYLANNTEISSKMSRNGINVVEKTYNWESEEKKLLDIYDKIIYEDSYH